MATVLLPREMPPLCISPSNAWKWVNAAVAWRGQNGLELGEELLTFAFLALLAVAWIAIFLPALLRAREATPLSTAQRFKRRLELMAPRAGSGRWVIVPESPRRLAHSSFRRAQQRRLRLFLFLLGAVVVTGLAALTAGGGLVEVHLAFDVSLAIYCALLIEAKRRRHEIATKVRSLAARRRPRATEVAFYEPIQAHGQNP